PTQRCQGSTRQEKTTRNYGLTSMMRRPPRPSPDGYTAANIDNLNTISGIKATATTRLFELWYEQHIGDWLRIRIGQQSAGQEFLISTGAKPFINSAFGWPTLPGVDLPSGGPNYPLATPAVRFRIDANDELTLFA